MHRRSLLKGLPFGLGAAAITAQDTAPPPLPRMKITRVRYYHTKTSRLMYRHYFYPPGREKTTPSVCARFSIIWRPRPRESPGICA